MKAYSKEDPYMRVTEGIIGRKYHLSWASDPAMVWVLVGWENEAKGKVIMETPKTKKRLVTDARALLYTREDQYEIEMKELRKKQEEAPPYDF